jgi:hypothetical protein
MGQLFAGLIFLILVLILAVYGALVCSLLRRKEIAVRHLFIFVFQ